MYKSIKYNIQGGYTLLEILIGIGLGLFILANGIFMYSTIVKSYYDLLAATRLDEQLRSSMNLMVKEIRRAGYSSNAIANLKVGANNNVFMAAANDIKIPSSSCILFTYDSDSSGILPALNAANYDKRFGFRLSGTILQSRALTDSSFDCNSGTWENLTDSKVIQINSLSFISAPAVTTLNSTDSLTIRNITISISAQLKNDSGVTKTITDTVRVRNDRFQP